MVATQCDALQPDGQFVIRPNSSLSWRGSQVFFAGMLMVSLVISSGFALMGAWLIFPFAGMEMALLGTCLYISARRAQEREVVRVSGDRIEVSRGRRAPSERKEMQRAWAQVVLYRAKGVRPSRLTIRSHGREIEVGGCLNETERQGLALDLARMIGGGSGERLVAV